MIRPLRLAFFTLVSLGLLGSSLGAQEPPARPRLVVLLSIDQFRADYQTRFADLYLPATAKGSVGGFRYLMERGAYHTDAHHDHFPLLTGPGHSVLLTGAPPYKTGIVGNDWFDRGLGRDRYCVEDPDSPLVGTSTAGPGISPATLRVSTVGDELTMATGGRAKVWGLALKDRAAVLMAGHLADGVLWLDDQTGAWITSRFYRKDGTLPAWVAEWNAGKKIDAFFGRSWTLSVPPSALERLWTPDNRYASDPSGLGKSFAHKVDGGLTQPGPRFYTAFKITPYANAYVLDTARELVRREGLGADTVPDVLAINLSSHDYIGHAYGPDSAEVLDVSVQTDRDLSAFFNFLAKAVPGGLASVTIVVSADHGVAPIAPAAKEAGLPAGVFTRAVVSKAAEDALDAAFGPADWSQRFIESNLYLNLATLTAKGIAAERAEEVAAGALRALPGIYTAYTRSQLLAGRMLDNDIARRVSRSFHPKVSGDVTVVVEPFWVPGRSTGATHGAPYAYDTAVPLLLAGAGIRPGRYTQRVSTLDIAPTLSDLLGILQPSGCEGRILSHAVR